jgi:RNA polymerase sigma factor (sigma-70 family)
MHGAIIDESRRNSLVRRTDARNGERAITVSLDEVWENSGTPKIEIEGTHGDLDNLIDFCDAIASLKPRERLVVNAIGEGVTQREIAEKLGITESRVSQIASAARAKLKEKMAA